MNLQQPRRAQSQPWNAILMGGFHAFNAVNLIGGSLMLILVSVVSYTDGDRDTALQFAVLTLSLVACGFILFIPLYHNARRLFDYEDQPARSRINAYIMFPVLVLLWVASLGLGSFVMHMDYVVRLVTLPFINLAAMGLPVLAIAWLGVSKLPVDSARRGWNIFALGLTLGPMMILVFEIMAFMAVGVLALLFVALNPNWVSQMVDWANNLESLPMSELQVIGKNIVQSPWLPFSVVMLFSVVVPLVEEPLKVIGMWLAADRIHTPAEGFALGILSGAGYALFESLGASAAVMNEDWISVAIARSGTSLLHILNSGILGWALVSAWRERKFVRLGLAFALTIVIHGAWNSMSLGMGISELTKMLPYVTPAYLTQPEIFSYGLIALVVILFFMLGIFNLRLRPASQKIAENVVYNQPLPIPETGETSTNGTSDQPD